MILSMTSESLTRGQMYDAADTIVAQKLMQLEGVGDVFVGGGSQPAVRVELNPDQLSSYGISMESIRNIIKNTNAQPAERICLATIPGNGKSRPTTRHRKRKTTYR